MTNKTYHIDIMSSSELKEALLWAKEEGWNPGLYDATCFQQVDKEGFFAGKIENKMISAVSVTNYDEHYAFSGLFIVHPKYRGQNYGMQLAEAVASHAAGRNVGCDGVLNMVEKYKKMGFSFAHCNARYACQALAKQSRETHTDIHSLQNIPLSLLEAYDRQHFPAARLEFLKCWIAQPKSSSLGYLVNGKLRGYGVIRACHQGYKIGPLFADTKEIAEILLLSLSEHAGPDDVYIDVPGNNPYALELVHRYALKKVFETARMYTQGEPSIATDQIYGITSFELG